MKRRHTKAITHTQKYYGGGINPDRGMSRRAKRQGNHRLRQALKQDQAEQEQPMTQYVCCYVENQGKVLLIEKRKPAWQLGKYNLPGGKIEEGETAAEAATRELFEEANLQAIQATTIGRITGDDWDVYVVRCVTPHPERLHQKTSERVFWMPLLTAIRSTLLIPNLRLIIPLAATGAAGWSIDEGSDQRTNHCTVKLPCEYLPI
jgi:ADP-ribose pyrophosphatase YjhB (NUDIX family)